MVLNVVISNCLIIDLPELHRLKNGEEVQKGIEKLLTYKNPKHAEALRFGYSTWGIPTHLYSYEYSGDNRGMMISRGAKKRVAKYLGVHGIQINYIDQTLVTLRVDYSHSKTVLRGEQNLCVGDMLKHDDGVVIAYTSFGKTVTALEYIRKIGQRAIIIVHTTFLQDQWIAEITNPKTFNMDIKDVGGVGGSFKKRKMGKINVCLYHSLKKDDNLEFFIPYIGCVITDEVQKSPIDDIQKCANMFPARYRKGVSARIERKDGKEFLTLDSFGDVIHTAIEKDGDSKVISSITIVPTGYEDIVPDMTPEMLDGTEPIPSRYQTTPVGAITRLGADRERNILICKLAISKMRQGKLVLIFVERKEQAGYLMKMLSKFRGDMLIGSVDKNKVDELECPQSVRDILINFDHEGAYDRIVKLADKKEIDFIIGSQKAEVGLSIRTIDVAMVTTPAGNNIERFNQMLGRSERTYSEDQEAFFGHKKTRPEVIVLKDNTKASRKAVAAIKEVYGKRVTEVKKRENSNVILRKA